MSKGMKGLIIGGAVVGILGGLNWYHYLTSQSANAPAIDATTITDVSTDDAVPVPAEGAEIVAAPAKPDATPAFIPLAQ